MVWQKYMGFWLSLLFLGFFVSILLGLPGSLYLVDRHSKDSAHRQLKLTIFIQDCCDRLSQRRREILLTVSVQRQTIIPAHLKQLVLFAENPATPSWHWCLPPTLPPKAESDLPPPEWEERGPLSAV